MASFQKEKELPESKENPLALTLGTTILLTLRNFLIAQHKSIEHMFVRNPGNI